jgi:hypothetical protein
MILVISGGKRKKRVLRIYKSEMGESSAANADLIRDHVRDQLDQHVSVIHAMLLPLGSSATRRQIVHSIRTWSIFQPLSFIRRQYVT